MFWDYTEYKTKAKVRLGMCAAACKEWIREHPDSLDAEIKWADANGGGLFLRNLFDRLESFFSNSTAQNVILTRILVQLLHFPFPSLHLFLLNKNPPSQYGIRSIYSVLTKVFSVCVFRVTLCTVSCFY
jgi:hypothetical protein